MKFDVVDLKKIKINECEIPDHVVLIPYDNKFISMHFSRMKKNNYTKTNKTKTISEVSGTKKKPHPQKHTGRARQGSLRSPHHVGGSVAFGPRAVQVFIKLPKAETALAKKILISKHVNEKSFFILSSTLLQSHKTKDALDIFSSFIDKKNTKEDFKKKKITIVHNKTASPNTLLAVRNIPNIKYVDINMLTVFDLMKSNIVLFDVNCLDILSKL